MLRSCTPQAARVLSRKVSAETGTGGPLHLPVSDSLSQGGGAASRSLMLATVL